jgi:hypothetical protein
MLIRLEIAAVDVIKMWFDILKSRKVKGSIFRRLLLEHVEETGYQDEYIIEDVIDSIFEEYKRLYLEDIDSKYSPKWFQHREKMNMFIHGYFPEEYERISQGIQSKKMVKINQQEDLEKGES